MKIPDENSPALSFKSPTERRISTGFCGGKRGVINKSVNPVFAYFVSPREERRKNPHISSTTQRGNGSFLQNLPN